MGKGGSGASSSRGSSGSSRGGSGGSSSRGGSGASSAKSNTSYVYDPNLSRNNSSGQTCGRGRGTGKTMVLYKQSSDKKSSQPTKHHKNLNYKPRHPLGKLVLPPDPRTTYPIDNRFDEFDIAQDGDDTQQRRIDLAKMEAGDKAALKKFYQNFKRAGNPDIRGYVMDGKAYIPYSCEENSWNKGHAVLGTKITGLENMFKASSSLYWDNDAKAQALYDANPYAFLNYPTILRPECLDEYLNEAGLSLGADGKYHQTGTPTGIWAQKSANPVEESKVLDSIVSHDRFNTWNTYRNQPTLTRVFRAQDINRHGPGEVCNRSAVIPALYNREILSGNYNYIVEDEEEDTCIVGKIDDDYGYYTPSVISSSSSSKKSSRKKSSRKKSSSSVSSSISSSSSSSCSSGCCLYYPSAGSCSDEAYHPFHVDYKYDYQTIYAECEKEGTDPRYHFLTESEMQKKAQPYDTQATQAYIYPQMYARKDENCDCALCLDLNSKVYLKRPDRKCCEWCRQYYCYDPKISNCYNLHIEKFGVQCLYCKKSMCKAQYEGHINQCHAFRAHAAKTCNKCGFELKGGLKKRVVCKYCDKGWCEDCFQYAYHTNVCYRRYRDETGKWPDSPQCLTDEKIHVPTYENMYHL